MLRSKIVVAAVTLASLAVPALAHADPVDHQEQHERRDNRFEIERLRHEIDRREADIARDRREHRWNEARFEERQLERDRARLRELMRENRFR